MAADPQTSPAAIGDESEWNRAYDEAMQSRDWVTCEILMDEREQADWWKERTLDAEATEYIDASISAQVALGYGRPEAKVRASAIRLAEKAIRQLRGLKS